MLAVPASCLPWLTALTDRNRSAWTLWSVTTPTGLYLPHWLLVLSAATGTAALHLLERQPFIPAMTALVVLATAAGMAGQVKRTWERSVDPLLSAGFVLSPWSR